MPELSNQSQVTPEQQEIINAVIQVLKERRLTFKEAAFILHLTRDELDNLSLYSRL